MNGNIVISPGAWLAPAVDWLNLNFRPLFAFISYIIESTLGGINSVLLSMPPYALVALSVVFALVLANRRIAVLVALAMGFCYVAGLWEATVQTVTLVTISVVVSVAIAFPLGVVASRVRFVESALRPVLDIMQTVPPWVYLIPAVIIFSLGSVPAIIATVIYGVPPMLRLTTLAFKQVPKDLLELGQAIGATRRAILVKIELPAAMPTLLVGLNQCILLSLAMVVLAGLVGAGGLGAEVTRGLTRMEMGVGLRAGLAIVTVAIVLDRLSRGAIQRHRTSKAG
ncbi:ABC transporter permease [Azospirillum canadense]|uniref:ABC transporter permease n=1 Tax=Azospirillum canadense TaxID=403962 RepID=UPI002227A155|nr:ABC transporter permease subunit [Azospirillum canadense]MCW2242017.1 glycine betaine/proline transport system permease protein [Azospirillum canadense]